MILPNFERILITYGDPYIFHPTLSQHHQVIVICLGMIRCPINLGFTLFLVLIVVFITVMVCLYTNMLTTVNIWAILASSQLLWSNLIKSAF